MVEALVASGVSFHPVPLDPGDEGAYGRLIRRLWSVADTFVICEQDVAPTAGQLRAIWACGHEWCSFNYDTQLYARGPSFGLVRFDHRTMTRHPLAADVALVTGRRRDREAEWWQVDSLLARDLMIRGVTWTEHRPAVTHLHPGPPSGPYH